MAYISSVKVTSLKKTFLWALKIFSGFIFAWVFTVMGREFINFGLFSFVFLLISLTTAFIYLVKDYKYVGLFFVLVLFMVFVVGFGFVVDIAHSS